MADWDSARRKGGRYFLTIEEQIQLALDLEERPKRSVVEQLALERLQDLSSNRERIERHYQVESNKVKHRQRSAAWAKKNYRPNVASPKHKRLMQEQDQKVLRYLKAYGPCVVTGSEAVGHAKSRLKRKGLICVIERGTKVGEPSIWDLTEAGFALFGQEL